MARIHIAQFCKGSNVTRPDGARLRAAIEQHWNDSEPITLDFSDLRIASVSFFDESIGLLARAHGRETIAKQLRVENIDPNDRNLLNEIVSSRAREHEHAESGDEVKRLLRDAGVPDDILAGWDGNLLALYQQEQAARGDWALDLGHYATALPPIVGSTLKARLDHLGITYKTHSLGNEWFATRRPSASP